MLLNDLVACQLRAFAMLRQTGEMPIKAHIGGGYAAETAVVQPTLRWSVMVLRTDGPSPVAIL